MAFSEDVEKSVGTTSVFIQKNYKDLTGWMAHTILLPAFTMQTGFLSNEQQMSTRLYSNDGVCSVAQPLKHLSLKHLMKYQSQQGALVVFFSCIAFLIFLAYRISMLFLPTPDLGGVENNVIYFIQRLLSGQPVYSDPSKAPYAIAQYGPLYYHLCATIANMLGIKADNVFGLFIISRIISLVCNIFFCLMLFAIAKKIFRLSFGACLTIVCFAFIFIDITAYSRPDSLYQVFFFVSTFYMLQFIEQPKLKLLVAVAVFSMLAMFTKQTGIMLPVLLSLWFIFHGRWKYLFYYTTICIATGLLLLFAFHANREFFLNVVGGVNSGISLHWFLKVIVGDFYEKWGLLLVPAFIIILYRLKNLDGGLSRFLSFFLTGVFIISNLLGFKFGSTPGYFSEWWALLFILAAYFFMQLDFSPVRTSAIYILIFMLVIRIAAITYPFAYIRESYQQYTSLYESEKKVASRIRSYPQARKPYSVFCNLYSPKSFLNNFLFREAVLPQYEIVIYTSYNRQVFDYSYFKNGFTNGAVPYIISRDKQSFPIFMDIKMENYRLTDSTNGYFIYSIFNQQNK
jgi:hypothetical protein